MTIELDPLAAGEIEKMARLSRDGLETGGILLGHGPDTNGVVHVDGAGDPGSEARREPGFFLRDLEHAQKLAAAAWSDRKAIWVGEWHTHLHGDPRPSSVDLNTYAHLLASADLQFEVFVSIIAIPDAELGWSAPQLTPWTLAISEIPTFPRGPNVVSEGLDE